MGTSMSTSTTGNAIIIIITMIRTSIIVVIIDRLSAEKLLVTPSPLG